MPATITSLVTSGSPGEPFTLNGTGFGAADPESRVFMFPDPDGNIVECTITTWGALQVVGTLPVPLTEGDTGYLTVQLVGEDRGTTSPSFTVGPRINVAVPPTFPDGTRIGFNTASPVDVDDVPIPWVEGEPFGFKTSDADPGESNVEIWADPKVKDTPTIEYVVDNTSLRGLGELTIEAQVAQRVDAFQNRFVPR